MQLPECFLMLHASRVKPPARLREVPSADVGIDPRLPFGICVKMEEVMTSSEEAHLQQFLSRLVEARAETKDLQAEQMIALAFKRQPNAAYLLTQRAMALGVALQVAQQRIRELEESLQAAHTAKENPASAAGPRESSAWGRQGYAQGAMQPARFSGPASSGGAAPSRPMGAAGTEATARPAAQGSWTQGLMGSLVGAAAGVVVGQALWQGMQSLLAESPSQHGGAGGFDASGFASGESGFTQVADAGSAWDAAGADDSSGFESDFADGDWI
jgi:hypothetical protein